MAKNSIYDDIQFARKERITELGKQLEEAHGIMEGMAQSAATETKLIKGLDGRITELEKQLAMLQSTETVDASEPQIDDSRTGLMARLKEAEKREAVLRKQVEYCKTHHELPEEQPKDEVKQKEE